MSPTESTNLSQNRQPGQHQQTEATAQTESTTPSTQCSECGGRLVEDQSTKELHCEECGVVAETSNIDHGPEWRNFDDETNRSRVGAPLTETIHDRGLSTEISWEDKDGYGNTLAPKQREKMGRLRKWNKRFKTKDHKDRDLRKATTEILRMTSALGLPDSVSETASVIYRRASSEDLIKGYAIEAIASAALYISTRAEGIPRTFEEIGAVSRVNIKRIRRAQTRLRRELNIKLEPAEPAEYIPRYASKIDANHEIQREAIRLSEEFTNSTHGHDPSNVAAAALHTASLQNDQYITQLEVEKACETSAPTLRRITKLLIDLDPESELELPELEDMNTTEIGERLKAESQ
jgi:transcription initiation factor TFIIB